MGKNQAYKAMQRARVGSGSGGPDEVEDGMVDGSFHSPEWHAARLASLKTSHTITWEEYKQKQKEDLLRQGELEKDTDKLMREYRAQLDADRARKLSHGRNHRKKTSSSSSSSSKRRTAKHSRRRQSSASSSSSSTSSSDDDDRRDSRKRRSKSHRSKKKKKPKSNSTPQSHDGPVPLSRFFGSPNT